MIKAAQICRQFKPGDILTKPSESKALASARTKHTYIRGPLPWEDCSKFVNQPRRKLRKKKEKPNKCPSRFDMLQKPQRNAYEWVTEDPVHTTPRMILDKTVCEVRRYEKCMRLYANECVCKDLAPYCKDVKKVYPMLEVIRKRSLPGCAKPLPPKPEVVADKPEVAVDKPEEQKKEKCQKNKKDK